MGGRNGPGDALWAIPVILALIVIGYLFFSSRELTVGIVMKDTGTSHAVRLSVADATDAVNLLSKDQLLLVKSAPSWLDDVLLEKGRDAVDDVEAQFDSARAREQVRAYADKAKQLFNRSTAAPTAPKTKKDATTKAKPSADESSSSLTSTDNADNDETKAKKSASATRAAGTTPGVVGTAVDNDDHKLAKRQKKAEKKEKKAAKKAAKKAKKAAKKEAKRLSGKTSDMEDSSSSDDSS
jgi:hypothetical protein